MLFEMKDLLIERGASPTGAFGNNSVLQTCSLRGKYVTFCELWEKVSGS